MSNWIFEKSHPMGGAAGQAFNNPLQGTLQPEALLAREAIQNSCDASATENKVRVVFRKRTLCGDAKRRFLDSLGVVKALSPRYKFLGFDSDNCVKQYDDDSIPLQLLYVEDYETTGISGNPLDDHSHFHRLLLTLGDDAKSHDGKGDRHKSTGGSYGYGKSVYSANSRIHTILAYSAFDPKEDREGVSARLMGCGFYDKHRFEDEVYTGRAWLGCPRDGGIVEPYEDNKAHEKAIEFGFELREGGEYGTTLMIVDCDMDMQEIRKFVETWWWPRICDDNLDVDLVDDGKPLMPPRPKAREDLRPFIRCYDLATKRSHPEGKYQKSDNFHKLDGISLGAYGFETLDSDIASKDDMQDRANCVALIREPRMVVKYDNVGKPNPIGVGVYVCDREIDHYLKLSEPPSHERWDHTIRRLAQVGEEGRVVVRTILDRIKTQFRSFQRDALPPTPPAEQRLKFLERDLGALFKPTLAPIPPGVNEPGPVSIHFLKQPAVIVDGDRLVTMAEFSLSLKEDADIEEADLTLEARVPILEDENQAEGDNLPLTIESDLIRGVLRVEDGSFSMPLHLERGGQPKFILKCDPYDPSWSTRVVVQVKKEVEAV